MKFIRRIRRSRRSLTQQVLFTVSATTIVPSGLVRTKIKPVLMMISSREWF